MLKILTVDTPEPGPSLRVHISNVSEDVWPFINALSAKKKQAEIDENAFLSDRDLLTISGHPNSILIVPKPVDTAFLQYYLDLFEHTNVKILVPKTHSGEICKDIVEDGPLFHVLLDLAKSASLELTSYSASYQFLDLVNALRSKGGVVHTPESPLEHDYWTTNFFGSKSGFRQLIWQQQKDMPELKMSQAYISYGIRDTAKIATDTYLQGGVVIKTSKGHSGVGVMIIRPGSLGADPKEVEQALIAKLKAEPYWDCFPTVIEDYIEIDTQLGGGNPNVEFQIRQDGTVQFLYACGMRVTREGGFKGVEISQDALPADLVSQMIHMGNFIGTQYAQAGYRGYFDLDCICSTEGELIITESNVRKTGGTHVYHAVKTLIGDQFMSEMFTVSSNSYHIPGEKKLKFEQVVGVLQPLLYNKEKKEGVILAAANLLHQHDLAYIVTSRTKERTLTLEQKMEVALATLS